MTIGNIILKAFEIFHKIKDGRKSSINVKLRISWLRIWWLLFTHTSGLIQLASSKGYKANLLNEVINVNNKIPKFLIETLFEEIDKNDEICILGLSFKPNSDDIRSSLRALL